MENMFEMVAKTFSGLEDVLRDELIDLGAHNVEMGNRMVTFEGDNELMYRANLCCRTALRILKPIVKFTAEDPDELYDRVRDLPWEEFIDPSSTFAIDATVYGEEFSHSRFVTYRVKDAIVDHFSDIAGQRPSVSVSSPDILLNVHISGNRVTLSLDSSGEPLYKRGYRVAQTEAPINEVLAAGIILKTGWRGDSDFLDPMCGSGTFLIEAALIATNTNPGIYRESFAFEKWKDFDADLFEELYNDDSAEREFSNVIYGGDISPDAVQAAKKNVRSAKMENIIKIECKDFSEWKENAPEGVLVTNPPYGERLKPENIKSLYRNFGSTLKNNFAGWNAWVFGYRDEHFAEIGLKPSMKLPLFNGSLECSLREYVMFNGSYSEFRADGGSVSEERSHNSHGPRKVRHISDDDWEKNSRKFNKGSKFGGKAEKSREKSSKPYGKPFETESRSFSGSTKRTPNSGYSDRKNRVGPREVANRGNKSDFGKTIDRSPRTEVSKRTDFKPTKPSSYNPANSKGPRISADKSSTINPVYFRSRKNRKEQQNDD